MVVISAALPAAKDILGYDLLRVCEEGPKADLDDTARAQPALLVAGLAALEKLRQDNPALIDECSACAGLSLGEYTALVFSGALVSTRFSFFSASPVPLASPRTW